MNVYKECTSDHKRTLYSLGIRRAIVFWNIIYAYIIVNFYWSELDTLSGQICCTLYILDIVHSYNREWIYCILDIVHILEQTVQLC